MAKSKILVEPSFELGFQTLGARLAFANLRQAFIEAFILYCFDLKSHIYIEINILGYAICEVLN